MRNAPLAAFMASILASVAGARPEPVRPVDFTAVRLESGLLAERQRTNATSTLEANWTQCEKTGRLSNFTRAARSLKGEQGLKYEGAFFNDSDVSKMLEGACDILATMPKGAARDALDARIDGLIATIAASQHQDGYLNGYFTLNEPDQKFADLRDKHELYCAGHLIEAAVAHHRATGKTTLLSVATRLADLIDATFGPAPKRPGVCGHEEIELALFKLAAETDSPKYGALATYFIEQRGRSAQYAPRPQAQQPTGGATRELWGEYCQDYAPVREHTRVMGHAVRSMYYYSAVTDLARDAKDSTLLSPLASVWDDLTQTKMYVTGGIGTSGSNEGFTTGYDLPNDTAYAETCAGIGLVLWAHRMACLHGTESGVYMDVAERALYNAVLSGVSLEGNRFFYDNPLSSRGAHHRVPWFGCACCPPNVLRLFAQLGGMYYATRPDALIVNMYGASTATIPSAQGSYTVTQKTSYPWDGRVTLRFDAAPADEHSVWVRIPGWSSSTRLAVNGEAFTPEEPVTPGSYAQVRRRWSAGDSLELTFDMTPHRMYAHPAVKPDRGRTAIQRGPIIYCFEGIDQATPLSRIVIPPYAKMTTRFERDLLGGVVTLEAPALAQDDSTAWNDRLYQPMTASNITLKGIPYFAWDNRAACEMQVWMPESLSLLPAPPERGVTTSASYCAPFETLAALNDGQEPASSGDHAPPRMSFWPHAGTTEWLQYDYETPRQVGGTRIYWFDDRAVGGGCRIPDGWRVLARKGANDEWTPLTGLLEAHADRFDEARFPPELVRSLRIEVQLPAKGEQKFSTGVLEWKVLK